MIGWIAAAVLAGWFWSAVHFDRHFVHAACWRACSARPDRSAAFLTDRDQHTFVLAERGANARILWLSAKSWVRRSRWVAAVAAMVLLMLAPDQGGCGGIIGPSGGSLGQCARRRRAVILGVMRRGSSVHVLAAAAGRLFGLLLSIARVRLGGTHAGHRLASGLVRADPAGHAGGHLAACTRLVVEKSSLAQCFRRPWRCWLAPLAPRAAVSSTRTTRFLSPRPFDMARYARPRTPQERNTASLSRSPCTAASDGTSFFYRLEHTCPG